MLFPVFFFRVLRAAPGCSRLFPAPWRGFLPHSLSCTTIMRKETPQGSRRASDASRKQHKIDMFIFGVAVNAAKPLQKKVQKRYLQHLLGHTFNTCKTSDQGRGLRRQGALTSARDVPGITEVFVRKVTWFDTCMTVGASLCRTYNLYYNSYYNPYYNLYDYHYYNPHYNQSVLQSLLQSL